MARSSSTKLTKFINATTVVTVDVANMWYGGLFGSPEGAACDVDDPLVAGHVHDGVHQDGHAQKIHLVNHVTSQLRNANLADNAVIKRNVQSFSDIGSAIPEFEGGNWGDPGTKYYLDLTSLRSEISNNGAFITVANVTSNSPGDMDLDDLVFGSDSLNDDGQAIHYNRMFFDKSKGAFRAGRAESISWNDAARGFHSAAFGRNTIASAARSTVAGGDVNVINTTGTQSFIGSGSLNLINGQESAIGAGSQNRIDSDRSAIGSGFTNTISDNSDWSFVGSGNTNTIGQNSGYSFIGAGQSNTVGSLDTLSSRSAIISGQTNVITTGVDSLIGSGSGNTITGNRNVIVNGTSNTVLLTISDSFIGAGTTNTLGNGVNVASNAFIGSGLSNVAAGNRVFIGSGDTNQVTRTTADPSNSAILGGNNNTIDSTTDSVILAGANNDIQGASTSSGIVAGENCLIDGASIRSGILAGRFNTIDGASINSSIGAGSFSVINNSTGAFVSGTLCSTRDSDSSGVSSGSSNAIGASGVASGQYAYIGGGLNNTIASTASSTSSVIAGGDSNIINGLKDFIGGGEANTITGTGGETSVIGGGFTNTINVVTGTPNLGDKRTTDPDGVFYDIRNTHVIAGGYTNTISNTGAGGEAGFIGGGSFNKIDDSEGVWHGHVITGGFNNLIQSNNYSFIGTGYENQIIDGGSGNPSYGVIITGTSNTIDSALGAVILNGSSNSVTAPHATVISSNNLQDADVWGAIHHSPSNLNDGRVIHCQMVGGVTNDDGTYYTMSLNNTFTPSTGVGGHEIIPIDSFGTYGFFADVMGTVVVSGVTHLIQARLTAIGKNISGTWSWANYRLDLSNSNTGIFQQAVDSGWTPGASTDLYTFITGVDGATTPFIRLSNNGSTPATGVFGQIQLGNTTGYSNGNFMMYLKIVRF